MRTGALSTRLAAVRERIRESWTSHPPNLTYGPLLVDTNRPGRGPIMLKRIAHYLGGQHWNAIAIEFLIVTAGVLMGIQVSNWNDDRLDKARADQQLASFHSELEGNLVTVKRYQQRVEAQLRDVLALERAFDRNDTDTADTDQKLMSVFRVSSMILETSAHDELNDSGSLRYVGADIRAAMTEWQARKGLIERADQDALTYRLSAVDHLAGALAFEPMIGTFAPAFQPAGNAPQLNDPARLAKDAKVRNFLAMRYGIETQKLQFAKDLQHATENLLRLLDDRSGN